MRVMHCPIEIAGQMGILSKGLQRLGVTSEAFNTFHTYLNYREHVHNVDIFELEWILQDAIRYFDVFHFHYAATMTQDFSDLEQIRSLGKSMIMHHWGNDVRTHQLAAMKNPYVYTGDSPPSDYIHDRLTKLAQWIEHAIVQDYEVYPYVAPYYKKVHVLPIAFDVLSVAPQYPSVNEPNPLVIHAPTNPLFKGTSFIEEALEQLRDEGVSFRYQRIENLSNVEALKYYREADIVVDQILCGTYGLFAVEAMSMGKPVIGFIREDLKGLFPEEPPIISADPDHIYSVLKEVITEPKLRYEAGMKGRKYAEKHHHIDVVAQGLLEIYRKLKV
ncbi:glycosyltransferase [Paenibacillus thermotolerans]|uniref:glycosyltransferase n=1 Tax=Paenibacillus thermotolerans TaxID=3027807 RepID=UPI002367E672|nr:MULTISPECIES: glycosyltransferase [unclassified Paenibacillus]